MRVVKFGGTSLATPARIRAVAKIVVAAARRESVIMVASAFGGVTNQLLHAARLAERADLRYRAEFEQLATRHRRAVTELLGKGRGGKVRREVENLLSELSDALQGVQLLRHCSPQVLDLVGSFGERLSSGIVAGYLNTLHRAEFVDARTLIVTDDHFGAANVDFALSNRRIRRALARRSKSAPIPVMTGFIGATPDQRTTTIGRDGSDYTAAIIGAALKADAIEIWTDVDGVLSADPRVVPSAFVLPQVSFEEAMELSYFGAKVVHSAAIAPAVAKKIPLVVRNTFRPNEPGTTIAEASVSPERLAKGITSISDVTLLTLRGLSMVGVPGTAERLFRALASNGVNVILISQASSEHTICFAIRSADAARAKGAVRREFRLELQHGLTSLDQKSDQAIVAVVGDEMKGHPGVSGRVFGTLGRHLINISAIAQGASERNISCVVQGTQQVRALNVIHQTFFERRKRLALVIVGVGNIGETLLRQVQQQRSFLRERGFEIAVVGLTNSRRFVLDSAGVDLSRWREVLSRSRRKMNPAHLASEIAKLELADAALVDCTASDEIVDAYPDFVRANLHIITPNKRANVLPFRRYDSLMQLMRERQKSFFDEANVGAGLPIMSTIRDLIASGDTIEKIEGVFSGTLSFLFNAFDGTLPFSSLVRDALAKGLTEPDPREDLSGEDVARKLLILARQTGSKMEMSEIEVESLVPRSLSRGRFSPRFFAKFAIYDSEIGARFKKAKARGAVLRYVGVLERGRARAGLKALPSSHPLAATKGSDNVIAFTTARYSQTPLVVQGPGAGADVTAMGVFSDILKLLNYLPH